MTLEGATGLTQAEAHARCAREKTIAGEHRARYVPEFEVPESQQSRNVPSKRYGRDYKLPKADPAADLKISEKLVYAHLGQLAREYTAKAEALPRGNTRRTIFIAKAAAVQDAAFGLMDLQEESE